MPSRRVGTMWPRSCSRGNATFRFSTGPSFRIGRSTPSTVCRCSSARRGPSSMTHARRLLTAQIVAVVCFILFPLKFTFQQPETHGLAGFLFAALTSFDKPFNQAPSLHIALLVILWRLYARHLPRAGAMAAAHLVRAGGRVGAHHLSAPFLRHSDRSAARLRFACGCGRNAAKVRCRRQRSRPIAGVVLLATRYLIGGAPDRRARLVDRRSGLVAVLARGVAGARRRQLRRAWTGGIPEGR